jgi:hypothetical protein
MPVPTLTVEVAFSSSPLTAAPVWTDVTAYVRHSPGVRISRGRPSESSTFSAGQLSLTLDNRDRRFDPLYSAGPYFGNLTPRKQIRVRATSGSTVDVFRGFVTGWPTQYPVAGRDAVTTITAYDGLAFLNEITMPDQVYRYSNTTVGSLFRYFRQADATGWFDAKNGDTLTLSTGAFAAASSPLAVGLTNSTPVAFGGSTAFSSTRTTVATSGNSWSISFWMQTTTKGPSATNWMSLMWDGLGDGRYNVRLGVDSSGILKFSGFDSTPLARPTVESTISVADGYPHHVVLSGSSGPCTVTMYIDGVNRSAGQSSQFTTCRVLNVGGAVPNGGVSDIPFVGTISDIAYFTKAVSAAEALAMALIGTNRFGQFSVDRVTTVLDAVDWPASWRSLISTTTGYTEGYNSTDDTALNQLQLAAATEQGRMFVQKDGNVTIHGRFWSTSDARGNTVQATFADDGTGIGFQSFAGFDPGDRDVVNDASVASVSTPQRSQDATSISGLGQRSTSVTTVATAAGAKAIADGIVYLRKTARSRALPIEVSLTDSSTFATLLGLEIGDRYRVKLTPLAVGGQISQDLHIESIDWDIDLAEWRLSIGGTPVPAAAWATVGTTTVGSTDVIGY